jgi:hypothetical protein
MRRNRHCNARLSGHHYVSGARKRTTARQNIGKITAVTLPIIISVLALVVARLSYIDEHRSFVSAATAQQEAGANLVTAYEQLINDGSYDITVQNLGSAPIYNVEVHATAIINSSSGLGPTVYGPGRLFFFYLGVLPPCSTNNIEPQSEKLQSVLTFHGFGTKKDFFDISPSALTFTDANQNNWSKSFSTGELQKLDKPEANNTVGILAPATTSNSCK